VAALSKRAVQAALLDAAPRCKVGDVVRLKDYPEEDLDPFGLGDL